jgi:hypothetical protein
MRRLGILLGAAGGIMGGFLAFVPAFGNALGVWSTLTAHRKFESAMALPTVQKAAKAIATAPAQAARRNPLDSLPPPRGGKFGGIPVDSTVAGARLPAGFTEVDPSQVGLWVDVVPQDGGTTIVDPNPLLKGNRDGVDSIQFDTGKRVTAIGFTTGGWVYRTEAPKFSAYLVLLAFPAFGFLLPWAVVRLVTWVGTGFFTPKSS